MFNCLSNHNMFENLLKFCSLFIVTFWKPETTGQNISTIFSWHGLVPQLIPFPPKECCTVIFPPHVIITIGKNYQQFQTLHQPEVVWNASDDKLYTLYAAGVSSMDFIYPDQVVVGPQNRFPRSEWIQWLVYDIPGNEISEGKVLYPFANFSNPSDIVRQAYVFLVFEHDKNLNLKIKNEKQKRRLTFPHLEHEFTPVRHFIETKNLTLYAGNFLYLVIDPTTTTLIPPDR